MPQRFLTYFLVAPFLVVLCRFLVRRWASPLRKYPGPILASGSRLWKVWSVYNGHFETDQVALHKIYGPIVRTGPNELSFARSDAAKDIFAVGKGFHKTDFYWVFPPAGNPDIFTEIREDVHALKKRYVMPAYSLNAMHNLSRFVEDTERLLLQKLDGFAKSSDERCDLGAWLHYFAFDVLGEIAFSRKFGFLATGTDVEGFIKAIDDIQWYDGIVGQIPEWHYWLRLNPLWKLLPSRGPPLVVRAGIQEIESRKKSGSKQIDRKDLLSQLLTAREQHPDHLSDGDVFAVVHGAIGAGSDSTASTMQSCCHFILKHPAIYEKLRREIDEADRAGKLSEHITFAEAQQLPYFQAVLKEAMRLRPAVGLSIYRRVPSGGAVIAGEHYPGGTEVALNGWVLHRDQAIWGSDAEAYRPERWMEGNSQALERHLFQFGGGSHLCIGRNLALLEMNKLLPQLFRQYDMRLVHPEAELKHNTTFFVTQRGLDVYLSRRK